LITLLSIFGFKEFARATGLYRERLFVLSVYLSMIAANALAYFGRFGLFMVVPMWAVALLTVVPIVRNRTEGMLQAFSLSVLGVVYFGWFLAHLTYLAGWDGGLGLVLFVGAAGQIGDLTLANFKRNVGIKDFGNLLPGHGGILDRLNSLTVVAPVGFHFVRFFFGGFS